MNYITMKTGWSVIGVEPTTFRTAATEQRTAAVVKPTTFELWMWLGRTDCSDANNMSAGRYRPV